MIMTMNQSKLDYIVVFIDVSVGLREVMHFLLQISFCEIDVPFGYAHNLFVSV